MWNQSGMMPTGMTDMSMYGQQMNYGQQGAVFQPPPPPPPPMAEFTDNKPPPLPDQPAPGANPAPPIEPPKEDNPPLPPDPPPKPGSGKELTPKDETEQIKLTVLQQQAAQWQQWQQYNDSVQMYQQPASVPSLEAILEEERQFEIQYSDWKKQYNDWKEQNKNHPNREQFNQYEQQWKTYEVQMEQKRHSILLRKEQAMRQQQYPVTHGPPPPVAGGCAPVPPRMVAPPVGVPPPVPVSVPPPPPAPSYPPPTSSARQVAPSTAQQLHHATAELDANRTDTSSVRPPSGVGTEHDKHGHQQSGYADSSSSRQMFGGFADQSQVYGQTGDGLGHNTKAFPSPMASEADHENGTGKDHRYQGSSGNRHTYEKPRFEDQPGQRPRFEGPQRPRFNAPPGQVPRFQGPPGPRQRYQGPPGPKSELERPPGPRPGFERPPGPRPGFERPPGPRPGFEGPPGPRPGFEGPPGPRPGFEGPPGRRPGFERPPGPRPGFERPPRPGFERPPRPGFEGPPGPRTEFEGPPGPTVDFEEPFADELEFEEPPRPRFEGPPGPRARFDGPPGPRPRFEGPPGQRPRFDGPPGRGQPIRRPFGRGQRGGFSRGQQQTPNAPVSLLELKIDRPPTLGRSEVIKDDSVDISGASDGGGEEDLVEEESRYMMDGGYSRGRGMRMRGRFLRGRAMPRGRGFYNRDMGIEHFEEEEYGYEEPGEEDFEEMDQMYDGSGMRGHGGFGIRGRGVRDDHFRGRGMPLRGRPAGMIGHDMPEGAFRGRFIGRRRPLPRRGMFGRGGPRFGGPVMHSEDYTEGEDPYDDYEDMHGEDDPGYHHKNDAPGEYHQQRKMDPGQFQHRDSTQSHSRMDSDERKPREQEHKQHMDSNEGRCRGEDGEQMKESHAERRDESEKTFSRDTWDNKQGFEKKDSKETGESKNQWAPGNEHRGNERTGGHFYSENRNQQGRSRWQDGDEYRHDKKSQQPDVQTVDYGHRCSGDYSKDSWNSSSNFDGYNDGKRALDMPEGGPQAKRQEGDNWSVHDKRTENDEQQLPGRVPELMSQDLSRSKSSQEEQKSGVPILSKRELDLIKQATEELKKIQGQKGQPGGSAMSRDSPSGVTSTEHPTGQESCLGETVIDLKQSGTAQFDYDDSLRRPQTYEQVDRPSRFARTDPLPDRLYEDPYRYDRPVRADLYGSDPALRSYEKEYMLTRDPLTRLDPMLARGSAHDPLIARDPLLATDPLLTRDPLARDPLYDGRFSRLPPPELGAAAPQVIDYGHGQVDDEDNRMVHEQDYDHRRPCGRDADHEQRYRGNNRGRDFDSDRDHSRCRRDRGHHDRDSYRDHDRDNHHSYDKRRGYDRGDESHRDHSHGRERTSDHLRRDRSEDRHISDRCNKPDRRSSPVIRENPPLSLSATASSTSSSSGALSSSSKMRLPQSLPPVREDKIETVLIDEILTEPGRSRRPDHIVVIVRGLPGAGKSYLCKLLKDKEKQAGGSAARILALDDYYMVEVEKTIKDPDSGKSVVKSVMEYEYDPELEPGYKQSFIKSFKRQIDDGYFNFFIIDAIFDKVDYLREFWAYAKSKGFQVYVAEVTAEPAVCAKRNVHKRSLEDIQKIADRWDSLPNHFTRLDVRSLLQDAAITEVEMEDTTETDSVAEKQDSQASTGEEEEPTGVTSKWEIDTSDAHLDKLDGLRHGKLSVHHRMEDYLQLPDDYDMRMSEPGKKRVRWADIEERKSQARMRDIGFVLGQTNWDKMVDDSYADRALNQTKYI